MAKDKLQEYFEDRSKFYDALTPGQLQASAEIAHDREKIIEDVDRTKRSLTEESNQFERTHTSFFAVAISLIVAGMLSKLPVPTATDPAKIFYITSISSALLTAILLFIEFAFIKRAFKKWLDHTKAIADYTNSSHWTPVSFNKWIKDHNTKAKTHTTNKFFYCEVVLLSLSFLMLIFYLVELSFDPYWFIFR